MKTKIAFPDLIARRQNTTMNAISFIWNKGRVETAHEKAFKIFEDYIEKKLLQECRAIGMKLLLEKFQELLIEEG